MAGLTTKSALRWTVVIAVPFLLSALAPLARSVPPLVAPAEGVVAENLVAETIDLDPSITELPSLPARNAPPEGRAATQANRPLSLDPPASLEQAQAGPITEPPTPGIQPEPPAQPELPASKAWPQAAGLIEQLNALAASTPEAAAWAASVTDALERLSVLESLADPTAQQILIELRSLADEAKKLASSLPTEYGRSNLLRSGYSIVRRLAIWDAVYSLAASGSAETAPIVDRLLWSNVFAEVDNRLNATGAAANWRTYLLFERARDEFDSSACSPADQRALARDILNRMHSSQLSHDQSLFLKSHPFDALSEQLKQRAAETPDLVGLLTNIERYEHVGLSAEALGVASTYDQLRWSSDPRVVKLSETMNAYYRNANVRVALSGALINRMLPKNQRQYEPVEDVILGAKVSGDSLTNSRVRMVLLPDRRRWRIGLEARGEVASSTASSKGPATFYQDGRSSFRARKLLTVDRRGIRMSDAEAEANANNSLSDFETDFDGIPLLSNLARAIAQSQYEDAQPAARQEVESKIINRATTQLDREVAERLQNAKRDLQVKLIDPLRKLDLDPTAVDMETTDDRLIARYRIAGRDHLSAHTPRPQAPGDSVLSVQLHETALNNVLDHLELQGRKYELRELFKEMTSRFNREPVPVPDDLPEDVYVTFADEDPVRIDCEDGRVRLTISLKELSHNKNRWQNFTVRGYYAPDADQLDANLVRDGGIELIGNRLRFGDRVTLGGIFSRVLSRNQKLNLVNEQIAASPMLTDQQVTQFVIHDGWIGVALGPKSPGRQAAMQPRPDLDSLRR